MTDPTVEQRIKDGPSRADAIPAPGDTVFACLIDALPARFGSTWWNNWGQHLTGGERSGELYRLHAGTSFRARHIGQEYGNEIAALIRSVAPEIRRVDVIATPERITH